MMLNTNDQSSKSFCTHTEKKQHQAVHQFKTLTTPTSLVLSTYPPNPHISQRM